MILPLRWLLPRRISSQIAALVLVSLIVMQATLMFGFWLRSNSAGADPGEPPGEFATLILLLDGAEPGHRAALLGEFERAFPRLQLRLAPPGMVLPREDEGPRGPRPIRHLPPGIRVAFMPPGEGEPPEHLFVRLHDGTVIAARLPPPPRPPHLFDPILITVLFFAILLALLGWWAARALTRPLRAFAAAAEEFSPDGEIALLPERGPEEIRAAAQALNRMRNRVKGVVEERSRMLAAVGHDLRTPITRMRLRSEFIDDEALRQQMLADLEQMAAMVESLLMFMRGGAPSRTAVAVDLAASLLTICDQFTDMGHAVSYAGPDHASVRGHPDELHRAITNLVDNAVRYGGGARVRLETEPAAVVVAVEDDGPGIPDDRKAAMLHPFVRGEAARSMDGTTGFGLGLSIADVIVRAHHGTMTLHDRTPSGLLVRIRLPVESESASRPPRERIAAAKACPTPPGTDPDPRAPAHRSGAIQP